MTLAHYQCSFPGIVGSCFNTGGIVALNGSITEMLDTQRNQPEFTIITGISKNRVTDLPHIKLIISRCKTRKRIANQGRISIQEIYIPVCERNIYATQRGQSGGLRYVKEGKRFFPTGL